VSKGLADGPGHTVGQPPARPALAEVTAWEAEGEIGALARSDVIALGRLRDYQGHIDRASALLHKLQPDLVAGETVSVRETELSRSNWPFILAIAASGLFWLGIAWAVAALV
jgi:hypothetical protein